MRVGIIKERKTPPDKRVPLTPEQARMIKDKFPIELVVECSDIRCFSDEDYRKEGVEVVTDLSTCDVLLGVKEVPPRHLIPEKIYFFFSHTIKKQAYNRHLLQTILEKRIQLVDWEKITDDASNRLIAFGRWAGIVGAYNALWTFGKRYNLYSIRRAFEVKDYDDLKSEFKKIILPKLKIAVTGGGRVSKGAMEVLHGVGIRKVTPSTLLEEQFDDPVFAQLNSRDYHKNKSKEAFNRAEFYAHPEKYENDFLKYARVCELLIAGAYWHPVSPVLFRRNDILGNDFNLKIVADITCDIEGSIPSTKRSSTIDYPIYDYNPSEDAIEPALSDEGNITTMAVDNLPCELPRDASESFGNELMNHVIPALLNEDSDQILKRATITQNGTLTPHYQYLEDFVNGK